MPVSAPSRRVFLQSVAGVILGLATYFQRPHWPGFFGGWIRAMALEPRIDRDDQLPPPEFVTPADDDRLVNVAPVQAVLQPPGQQISFERELSRREFAKTYSALQELPVFEPDDGEHPNSVMRGIYVRDREYTYMLQLVPWCSDAWWIETRGTPTGARTCARR